MPEGWTFTSGESVAFTVPEAVGTAASVSIVIGELTFPFAELPNPAWTAEEVVAVTLTETDGTYAAVQNPEGYVVSAPYTYTVADHPLSPTQRADLFADPATIAQLGAGILPINTDGTLILHTDFPPETSITVQLSIIDTQGVQTNG